MSNVTMSVSSGSGLIMTRASNVVASALLLPSPSEKNNFVMAWLLAKPNHV